MSGGNKSKVVMTNYSKIIGNSNYCQREKDCFTCGQMIRPCSRSCSRIPASFSQDPRRRWRKLQGSKRKSERGRRQCSRKDPNNELIS
ncbi:hypothetical protein FGO68_gene640 [Halteria grandinella]|uniref:Uncharacterized protein n=1 Tax=Halteria grandinella TaxID=5974 RepID=A0A8J8T5B8_HALGN|nr:hypothetical protein FGO68_gene640 [Halteria grandinella]